MQVYLETERLILRRMTADDLDSLVALDSDPAVMRFLTGGKPTPREEIERRYLPRVLGYYERYKGKGAWAAIERSTGAFLGWASNRPVEDRPDEVELGYRLRREAWGKGYATEAARALIDKSFTELGVQRVVANTMTVNSRLAPRDGEGRHALCAYLLRGLAGADCGRGARRRRV